LFSIRTGGRQAEAEVTASLNSYYSEPCRRSSVRRELRSSLKVSSYSLLSTKPGRSYGLVAPICVRRRLAVDEFVRSARRSRRRPCEGIKSTCRRKNKPCDCLPCSGRTCYHVLGPSRTHTPSVTSTSRGLMLSSCKSQALRGARGANSHTRPLLGP